MKKFKVAATLTLAGVLALSGCGGDSQGASGDGDVIALSVAVAPHDEESARCLDEITANHRVVLIGAARRLRDLAVLGDGTSDDEFADVADFYFGSHGGIRFMATDLGWEPERARTWITTQFARGFGVDVRLDR